MWHKTLDMDDGHPDAESSGHGPAAARFGAVIRQRRMDLGLTLKALAKRAGCSMSYLSQIESGRREAPPRAELVARLESALQLAEGELVALAEWHLTPEPIRHEVAAMRGERARTLATLRELLPRDIDDAWRTGELHRLVSQLGEVDGRHDENGPRAMCSAERVSRAGVPLINAVAAGPAREFTDKGYPVGEADEYVRAIQDGGDPDAFAARVTGQSMLPEYREGDIVVFSPMKDVKNGMDCFVRLEPGSEVAFKRVYFEPVDAADESAVTHVRLTSLNPAFAARVVPREQVAGLFAAVSVMRRLNVAS